MCACAHARSYDIIQACGLPFLAKVMGSLSFKLCPFCFACGVLAMRVGDWVFCFSLGAMCVWLFLYCEIQVKINTFHYPQIAY